MLSCPVGGGGGLLVSLVLMLEQRIAKHTLNSVLEISKLIPFALFSHKRVAVFTSHQIVSMLREIKHLLQCI